MKVNMSAVAKVAKTGVKYVGPIFTGVMTIASEIENMQLKNTVKELTKKVAEMEAKMK